ncbi:MAG TPA: alkaline phosphatase [Acidobacteriota bacterium]|nr:alkaline phosphatase [Acidobacteriota bacterium]
MRVLSSISPSNKTAVIIAVVLLAAFHASHAGGQYEEKGVKNVILMIGDGMSFNTVRATNYYAGSKAVYENFERKFGMQTTSAGDRKGYTGRAYDPQAMATDFNYAMKGATDSSSAASAMFSGVKIYDNEVNYTPGNIALTTFFEKAARHGKSIGAVSSVHFTHATPAAVYGHNRSRSQFGPMAREAIHGSNPSEANNYYDAGNYNNFLKVVMGPGHPMYDSNAKPREKPSYRLIGEEKLWNDLVAGVNGWTLISAREEFEKLTSGPTPDKVFGIPQVGDTLQYSRDGLGPRNSKGLPFAVELNTGVPDLATMTMAALNVLDNNRDGFAIMIEGGAIDWANHANLADRMIEEQIDFNKAVKAVTAYLDANTNGNNWDNTLLIVTSDHETGYLWGDGRIEGSTFFDVNGNGTFDHGVDYAHVKDNGRGNLPNVWFHSGYHSNSLVPLYARGAGSGLFEKCVIGREPNLRVLYNLDGTWSGDFVDNTCVYHVMSNATGLNMK